MPTEKPLGTTRMEAELRSPSVSAQVWHFDLRDSQQHVLRIDRAYRLDLSLTRRLPGTGLCFADHWDARRFEPAGKLFLLPPGETLRVRSGIGHQDAILCHIPADRVSAWLDTEVRWTDRRLEASLDIGCTPIPNLLLQLGEEARHPGFASEVLSEALAVQIAVALERYYQGITDLPAAAGLAPWRLRLIDDRLREIHRAPNLSELASLCKLSVRQLSRGFKVSRGISIGEHVAQHRMENAKRLLQQSASVKSVAYALGFASPSSFAYAFRKAAGMAPGRYKTFGTK